MKHNKVLDPESKAPDPQSLYALTDSKTGDLRRGSVPYYVSMLDGTAIPVEVKVAESLR